MLSDVTESASRPCPSGRPGCGGGRRACQRGGSRASLRCSRKRRAFRRFPVAEARGDEAEDLELPRSQAQPGEPGRVGSEWLRGSHRRWLRSLSTSQRTPEPDSDRDREHGDQACVDLEGVLEDEEAVLDQVEDEDEQPGRDAEDEDVARAREASASEGSSSPRAGMIPARGPRAVRSAAEGRLAEPSRSLGLQEFEQRTVDLVGVGPVQSVRAVLHDD